MSFKTLLIAVLSVLVISGCSQKEKHRMGQFFQGGRIFYIDSTFHHGLIVDTEDLGIMNWQDAIYTCKSYKGGGFTDWRLPTLKELNLLYQQKDSAGGFIHYNYWSGEELTSQEDDDSAYFVNFTHGNLGKNDEGAQNMVRAVRGF